MTLPEGAVVEIVRAEQIADYKLKLSFSDGAERIVAFEAFLQSSRNPLIRCFLDPQMFATFRIEDGDLLWGDYQLCFPIADLYENRL